MSETESVKVQVTPDAPYFYETPDLPGVKQKAAKTTLCFKHDTQSSHEEDDKRDLIDPSLNLQLKPLYIPTLKQPEKVSEIKPATPSHPKEVTESFKVNTHDLKAREISKDDKAPVKSKDENTEAILDRETLRSLKQAIASREEGSLLFTQDLIHKQKTLKDFRTKFSELEEAIAKRKNISKTLEWVNTGLTVATMLVSVFTVAVALATAGFGAVLGVFSAVGMAAKGTLTAINGAVKIDSEKKTALLTKVKEDRETQRRHITNLLKHQSDEERSRHNLYEAAREMQNNQNQISPFKNQ